MLENTVCLFRKKRIIIFHHINKQDFCYVGSFRKKR
jgi:hypothetical protein